MHAIDAENKIRAFGAASKSNTDWMFWQELHKIGRHAADKWLTENFNTIGEHSTLNIADKFL